MNRREFVVHGGCLMGMGLTSATASVAHGADAEGGEIMLKMENLIYDMKAHLESIPRRFSVRLDGYLAQRGERARPIVEFAGRAGGFIADGLGAFYVIAMTQELSIEEQMYPGVQELLHSSSISLGGALVGLRDLLADMPEETQDRLTIAFREYPELLAGVHQHLTQEFEVDALPQAARQRTRQMLRGLHRVLRRRSFKEMLSAVLVQIDGLKERATKAISEGEETLSSQILLLDDETELFVVDAQRRWAGRGFMAIHSPLAGPRMRGIDAGWALAIGGGALLLLVIAIFAFPTVFASIGSALLTALIVITCPIWYPIALAFEAGQGLAAIAILLSIIAIVSSAAIAGS